MHLHLLTFNPRVMSVKFERYVMCPHTQLAVSFPTARRNLLAPKVVNILAKLAISQRF